MVYKGLGHLNVISIFSICKIECNLIYKIVDWVKSIYILQSAILMPSDYNNTNVCQNSSHLIKSGCLSKIFVCNRLDRLLLFYTVLALCAKMTLTGCVVESERRVWIVDRWTFSCMLYRRCQRWKSSGFCTITSDEMFLFSLLHSFSRKGAGLNFGPIFYRDFLIEKRTSQFLPRRPIWDGWKLLSPS